MRWDAGAPASNNARVVETVVDILQRSREVYEGYTSPLGIGFIVFGGGDYKAGAGGCAPATPGPGDGPYGQSCPTSPGVSSAGSRRRRLDLHGGLDHYWVDPCSNYGQSNYSYTGLGCDRTSRGTGYADDYAPTNRDMFNDVDKCPTKLLLWFHNLAWSKPMPKPANYTPTTAGETVSLYDYIRWTHEDAVEQAKDLAAAWDGLEGLVDEERFEGVKARFAQQVRDAGVMRDAIMTQYTSWYRSRWPPE